MVHSLGIQGSQNAEITTAPGWGWGDTPALACHATARVQAVTDIAKTHLLWDPRAHDPDL